MYIFKICTNSEFQQNHIKIICISLKYAKIQNFNPFTKFKHSFQNKIKDENFAHKKMHQNWEKNIHILEIAHFGTFR